MKKYLKFCLILFFIFPLTSYGAITTNLPTPQASETMVIFTCSSSELAEIAFYDETETVIANLQCPTSTGSVETNDLDYSGPKTYTLLECDTGVPDYDNGCNSYGTIEDARLSNGYISESTYTWGNGESQQPLEATSTPDQVQQNLFNATIVFCMGFFGLLFFFGKHKHKGE